MAVNLLTARQAYQRRRLIWALGREGIALSRGDVCVISHDLASGGVSGRLAAGSAGEVTLDRPVAIEADSPADDRVLRGAACMTPGRFWRRATSARPPRVQLGTALDAAPSAGADGATARDWIWALYADDDPAAQGARDGGAPWSAPRSRSRRPTNRRPTIRPAIADHVCRR